MDDARRRVDDLAEAADRLDALADIAELMGDDEGAIRFRKEGATCRAQAMALLDQAIDP